MTIEKLDKLLSGERVSYIVNVEDASEYMQAKYTANKVMVEGVECVVPDYDLMAQSEKVEVIVRATDKGIKQYKESL